MEDQERTGIEENAGGSKNGAAIGVSATQGVSLGVCVVIAFMASITTGAVSIMGYDHFRAKKFLSVDVKGYVEQQQELYVAGKITDEQLKQSFVALRQVVEKIPKNRIVLMGDAVLGGVEKLDLSVAVPK